jgi:integrase
VCLHDLRHTAATLWLAAGESIYFVKEQLGQSTHGSEEQREPAIRE